MRKVFNNIKGDRLIWAIVALLAIVSFLPVYSAASNLAYKGGDGNTFAFFVKHFMHLFLGFAIMYGIHKIPYRYFKGLSLIMIPGAIRTYGNSRYYYRGCQCKSLDPNTIRWCVISNIHFCIGCFNGLCGEIHVEN